MTVIKRSGEQVQFNKEKIIIAIEKAMKQTGKSNMKVAEDIANEIEMELAYKQETTVSEIESEVYFKLIKYNEELAAKKYEGYRAVQEFKRNSNTTDESILGLLNRTNAEVMDENSNKDAILASTQRDLIAGEVSKDLSRRKLLPPEVVQAHDEGAIHFHDMDYFIQPTFNCCLVNIQDMLDNGTVINKRLIEPPKSFRVACTVMTQIVAQIASGQYGGQSINIAHLGKYLRRSKEKYYQTFESSDLTGLQIDILVEDLLHRELVDGIQTIQYQINTLQTANGQSPFLTLFLHIDTQSEYEEEIAMIIEEIFKQRLEGMKNEKGLATTPAFPKLVYVLDEHNCLEGGKYDYITKLAVQCNAKRLYPDYISAKKMRENYEGNIFSPMG